MKRFLVPLLFLIVLNTSVYLRLRKMTRESEVAIQRHYIQQREVMLAKVSCLIVIGQCEGRDFTRPVAFNATTLK